MVDEDEGFVTVCVVKTGQTLRDFMVTFTSSETIPTEAEGKLEPTVSFAALCKGALIFFCGFFTYSFNLITYLL